MAAAAAAAAATPAAVGNNFYWRQRGNADKQMAIDFSNLGEFQRQNQCDIEFVWVNKDKNRLSGLNLPGSVNGGGGGDERLNRKLTFAVDNFPPRFGIDQCFLLTKVKNDNLQPRFCCSTPKCYYTTFRADHLVKHQSKCTVSFFY